jgi:hypothetical protein
MGLWLTLWISTLVAVIVLAIIFRHTEGISLVFVVPVFFFAIGGLMIGLLSERSLEKQKFTIIDKVVNISTSEDIEGKPQLVFPSLHNQFEKVDGFKFDETIVSGDKLKIRIIRRETPRSFWCFKSSSDKIIFIIPEVIN